MATPTLIYCAGGNARLARIAIETGFKYGARLPDTVYGPLYFADQDWKLPNREAYVTAVAHHQPRMAVALDLEQPSQFDEVLSWTEDLAQHVDTVVLVPKYFGAIESLPRTVGGAEIRLGYSVPTRYGGTQVPIWEFADWPVHLLGGSPHKQAEIARYLDVRSVDGNLASKMALQKCCYYQPWRPRHPRGYWAPLDEPEKREGAPYRAFWLSCVNIARYWQEVA